MGKRNISAPISSKQKKKRQRDNAVPHVMGPPIIFTSNLELKQKWWRAYLAFLILVGPCLQAPNSITTTPEAAAAVPSRDQGSSSSSLPSQPLSLSCSSRHKQTKQSKGKTPPPPHLSSSSAFARCGTSPCRRLHNRAVRAWWLSGLRRRR